MLSKIFGAVLLTVVAVGWAFAFVGFWADPIQGMHTQLFFAGSLGLGLFAGWVWQAL